MPKTFMFDHMQRWPEWGRGGGPSDQLVEVQSGPASGAKSIKMIIGKPFDPEAARLRASLLDTLQ